jgi:hypothetical protein
LIKVQKNEIIENYFGFLNSEIEIRIQSLKCELDTIGLKAKKKTRKTIRNIVSKMEASEKPTKNILKTLQKSHIGILSDELICFAKLQKNKPEIYALHEISEMPVNMCQINDRNFAIVNQNCIYLYDKNFLLKTKLKSIDHYVFEKLQSIGSDLCDTLFICDHKNLSVRIADTDFLRIKLKFGGEGIDQGKFAHIKDACVSDKHIYILDSINKCIQKFDFSGTLVARNFLFKNNLHETHGYKLDAFLVSYPLKMCVSRKSCKVAVIADYGQAVYIYDNNEHLVQIIQVKDLCSFCYFKNHLVLHSADGSLYFYADNKSIDSECLLISHIEHENLKDVSSWTIGFDDRIMILMPYSNSVVCVNV